MHRLVGSMLIGYVRVSKADGSQTLAPQRDALLAAGVEPERLYQDLASGRRDDRPGLRPALSLRAARCPSHRDPPAAARRSRPGPEPMSSPIRCAPPACRSDPYLRVRARPRRSRVRLTDYALSLTETALAARSSLTDRAPETGLNLASGRASLRAATPSAACVAVLSSTCQGRPNGQLAKASGRVRAVPK